MGILTLFRIKLNRFRRRKWAFFNRRGIRARACVRGGNLTHSGIRPPSISKCVDVRRDFYALLPAHVIPYHIDGRDPLPTDPATQNGIRQQAKYQLRR